MIGKLFTLFTAARRAVTSPAGQVATAGLLLSTGARIVVSVLGEVVDEMQSVRGAHAHHYRAAEVLFHRLDALEQQLGVHTEPPPLPEDVEGWPAGKRVEVPVSAIRVEEPDGREL
ncbi:MAG: hypothetical protein AUG44_03415 [Actinobacteria bacterium 13_1_20CM_3_71_11]|nr:MAG: hypothetical protein AUG44_03415 [Actinobacteria bacterium 13_1_20CM_3_71_11]